LLYQIKKLTAVSSNLNKKENKVYKKHLHFKF